MKRRSLDSKGYVLVLHKTHPYASKRGYVYEHRLVAEKMIGRYLNKGEVVHHINQIKIDNEPINLVVLDEYEHLSIHRELTKIDSEMKHTNMVLFLYVDCGYTLAQVATELCIGTGVASRILNKHGAMRSTKNYLGDGDDTIIKRLYTEGYTQQQIADIFNVTRTPIKRVLLGGETA